MHVSKCNWLTRFLCRMLIPTTELGRFDSMVMPFELQAYDALKSRSGKEEYFLFK